MKIGQHSRQFSREEELEGATAKKTHVYISNTKNNSYLEIQQRRRENNLLRVREIRENFCERRFKSSSGSTRAAGSLHS